MFCWILIGLKLSWSSWYHGLYSRAMTFQKYNLNPRVLEVTLIQQGLTRCARGGIIFDMQSEFKLQVNGLCCIKIPTLYLGAQKSIKKNAVALKLIKSTLRSCWDWLITTQNYVLMNFRYKCIITLFSFLVNQWCPPNFKNVYCYLCSRLVCFIQIGVQSSKHITLIKCLAFPHTYLASWFIYNHWLIAPTFDYPESLNWFYLYETGSFFECDLFLLDG